MDRAQVRKHDLLVQKATTGRITGITKATKGDVGI
jgi:hypothetical protein